MIGDSIYNKKFNSSILKNTQLNDTKTITNPAIEIPVLMAGQICLNKNFKLSITKQIITLFDKGGKVLKSTVTNRFGAFTFSGVKKSEVYKIKVNAKDAESSTVKFSLFNSNKQLVSDSKPIGGGCEFVLKPEDINSLINNQYTSILEGNYYLLQGSKKNSLPIKPFTFAITTTLLRKKPQQML